MLYPPYNETVGKRVYDEVLLMEFGTLGNGGVHKHVSHSLGHHCLPLLPLLHAFA